MKTREEAEEAIDYLSLKNTYEDYPSHDFNWTVMRHKDNKKMIEDHFDLTKPKTVNNYKL